MMRFLLLAAMTTLAIFFATPMALSIVDGWCYIMLGTTVSGIAWTAEKFAAALAMLIPTIMCMSAVSTITTWRG